MSEPTTLSEEQGGGETPVSPDEADGAAVPPTAGEY